ncbi:DUF4383 domain-containing protein [Actinosynnema pretiosum subsp. pretiosum]|uniref:DUF4383 domain-containing protein n=1 Tax=Actinosynnema pretiosum subsp. pretiosum TaxID=103721 RepID=A0AA45L5A5_9PSEU|nr:hypothetical protein APASM_5421 [Actinosynnema pretiosum subsp. pretiosum]QUF03338.1 DUF4383 domain-containing protein [Actinosynnema pretiosum subsp. pretiosum]
MTHSTTTGTASGRVKVAGLQPAQVLTALLAVLLLAAGVVGFVRTGFGDFAGDRHAEVFGFHVNPLHNTVHLATGVLGLLMASGSALSRLYGWIVLLAYGAVTAWGLMITGVLSVNPVSGLGNPLAINNADNGLHAGLALAGLVIAILPARRKIVVDEPAYEPEAHHDDPVRGNRFDQPTLHHPAPEREVPKPRVEAMDPTVDASKATTGKVDPVAGDTRPVQTRGGDTRPTRTQPVDAPGARPTR